MFVSLNVVSWDLASYCLHFQIDCNLKFYKHAILFFHISKAYFFLSIIWSLFVFFSTSYHKIALILWIIHAIGKILLASAFFSSFLFDFFLDIACCPDSVRVTHKFDTIWWVLKLSLKFEVFVLFFFSFVGWLDFQQLLLSFIVLWILSLFHILYS